MFRTWQERELDTLLRDELKMRNFYLLGTDPVEFAPIPNGFQNREMVTEFLNEQKDNYRYFAYKNMMLYTGYQNHDKQLCATIYLKLGSCSRELCPVVNLEIFYENKSYKYSAECYRFNRVMQNADDKLDVALAISELTGILENTADLLLRTVRSLILENRLPQELNNL